MITKLQSLDKKVGEQHIVEQWLYPVKAYADYLRGHRDRETTFFGYSLTDDSFPHAIALYNDTYNVVGELHDPQRATGHLLVLLEGELTSPERRAIELVVGTDLVEDLRSNKSMLLQPYEMIGLHYLRRLKTSRTQRLTSLLRERELSDLVFRYTGMPGMQFYADCIAEQGKSDVASLVKKVDATHPVLATRIKQTIRSRRRKPSGRKNAVQRTTNSGGRSRVGRKRKRRVARRGA